MGAFDDLIPKSRGGAFDDLIPASADNEKRERRQSRATAADYLRGLDSGLAQGVAGFAGGVGSFMQAPAANSLSYVLGAKALAERGLTWLAQQAGGEAEVNPEVQEAAQQASRFAAEARAENAASPLNLVARAGRALEEDSARVVREVRARDEAENPELVAQQRNMAQAEGFVDNLRAIKDNPLAFTNTLARSMPDMAMGVGVGATVARAGGSLGRVSSAGILAEAGSSAIQSRQGVFQAVVDMPEQTLEQSPRYQQVLRETQGDRAQARLMLANELADQVPLLAGAGTAMGTVLTNRLFGGDATAKTIVGGPQRMTLKELGQRTLQDTVEEGIQGVPEDAVQYGAEVQADPKKKYDPAGSLAQNLAAGAAMGGGMHGIGFVRDRIPSRPEALPSQPPAQPSAPSAPSDASAPPAGNAQQGDLQAAALEEIDVDLERVVRRRREITPANGYGPSFDRERVELDRAAQDLIAQRAALVSALAQPKGGPGVSTTGDLLPTGAGVGGSGGSVAAPGVGAGMGTDRVGQPAVDAGGAADQQVAGSAPLGGGQGAGAVATPAGQPPADTQLQNRDRSRTASVLQMSSIARDPDYLRLGPSRTPDSGAPMVFAVGDLPVSIPKNAFGREDVAVMSDGQRVPFRYAVVDATTVNPSNFADGRENPLFSSQVPGTLKALNNGRTAGLRGAYEAGTAENYRQGMLGDVAMHGVPAEVIASTPNPMLVRVYSDGANTAGMAAKSQGQGLGMSPAELARQDADLMDTSVLSVYQPGDVDAADNRDFVRAFVGKLQGAGQDVAGMMTAGGQLSQDGRKRIQAALMQAAYGNTDLVEEMFDSTDTDIKAIGEALKAVAGEWADMRDSARMGVINPATDVTANLVQAIELIKEARRKRQALSEVIVQPDLMTGAVPDELTVGMVRVFYNSPNLTRATGRERLIEMLREYVRGAMATEADAGLFGGEPVSPSEILAKITGTTLAQESANGQQDQAIQGTGQPAGGVAAGGGTDQARPRVKQQRTGEGGRKADGDRGGEQGQDAKGKTGRKNGQGVQAGQQGNAAAKPDAPAGQPGAVDAQAGELKPDASFDAKSEEEQFGSLIDGLLDEEAGAAAAPDPAPDPVAERAARDMQLYPQRIINALIDRGEVGLLYAAARVRGATAFDALPLDAKVSAYVKFVRDGGRAVDGLPQNYNEYVRNEERDALVRRLQSEGVVRQANGRPFKTQSSAQQFQAQHDLTGTHEVRPMDGGFVLRRLPEAAQAEAKRRAQGLPSYTEAQAEVAAQMGIGQTPEGEWDASDEQFAEMEREVQARMRGEGAAVRGGADANNDILTRPTEADVLRQQQRAAKATELDNKEQIRKESEAGAGSFSLEMEDGRQDTTGNLFDAPSVGPFGPILTQYRGDAQGAIKALTELQDGEAVAALNHPEVGDIDLVWGKEGTASTNYEDGMGLAKIIKKHSEVIDDLQGFVSSLSVQKRSENRVILGTRSGRALVRLDWDGKAKHWLLTAYDDAKKASVANGGRTGVSAGAESAPPAEQGTEATRSVTQFNATGAGDGTRMSTAAVDIRGGTTRPDSSAEESVPNRGGDGNASGRESKSPKNEDVGDQLYANRRNFTGRGIKWEDVQGLNDTLKVKEVTKAKVWPRPDYEQLVDEGMPRLMARLVKQVYDGLSAGPTLRSNTPPTDEDLRQYIDSLAKIREGLFAFLNDKQAVAEFASGALALTKADRTLAGPIPVTDMLRAEVDGKALAETLLRRVWPQEYQGTMRPFARGTRAATDIALVGGNKAMLAMQFGSSDLSKWAADLGKGWPAKREAWQVQGYRVLKPDEYSAVGTEGRDGTLRMRITPKQGRNWTWNTQAQPSDTTGFLLVQDGGSFIQAFPSEQAAIEAAREKVKREGGSGQDIRGSNIQDAERTGPARRKEGEDISSERLMEVFGFRGVNFGREGWINQAERQAYLNQAYDGLMDLAEVLGVPPKAMSLNGALGIAFGAQGKGKASAHFVPGVNEINLTKTRGAGTLAHEWGHALDHHFATQAGLQKDAEPLLSEHADKPEMMRRTTLVDGKYRTESAPRFGDGIRPEIVQAFRAIRQAMDKRPETPAEAMERRAAGKARALKTMNSWLAAARRAIDSSRAENKDDLLAEFDQHAEKFREGDLGDGTAKSGNKAYPARVAAVRNLIKDATGRLWPADETDGLEGSASHYRYILSKQDADVGHVPQQATTQFRADSVALDSAKGGKAYWGTPAEMFARAFELYVHDKLAQRSASNTFLTDAAERAVTPYQVPDTSSAAARGAGAMRDLFVYPQGVERDALRGAFDALVGAIETRETEGGKIDIYERQGTYNGAYVADLFGTPLLTPTGGGGDTRTGAATAGQRNLRPAAAVPGDTPAPAGDYFIRTVVGTSAQRELGADVINSPEDLARATSYLYRSAVERFDAIVTDANGKPLAVVGGFKGALTEAPVYPAVVVAEAMRVPNAARIWFSHNHPSGKSTLSTADLNLAKSMERIFRGTGIEPMGFAAIGKGEFSFNDGIARTTHTRASFQPATRPAMSVNVVDRELSPSANTAAAEITSPRDTLPIARQFYQQARQPGVLMLNAQNEVAAWVPLTATELGPLRNTGGLRAIYRAISEANAGGAIIVHSGEMAQKQAALNNRTAADNVAAALAGVGVPVLDLVDVRQVKTAAELGVVPGAGTVLSRGPAKGRAPQISAAEADRQFRETERAYGGRDGYDRAKAVGKTKLNYRQWVQVRTPNFKQWFGDWEIAGAIPQRQASTFSQAREQAKAFQGKDLTNWSTGLVARVSRNSLDKMLNDKAVGKSESPASHSAAVANLDALFERAILGWSKPDNGGDQNIAAVHRFFAPVSVNGRPMLAKITVKEMADATTPNRIYSVESVEFNEKSPAAQWVAASADADGVNLTSTRSARDHQSLAQRVQDFNPATVSKVVDPETGEPMVVYHGTDADFSTFDKDKINSRFPFSIGYHFTTRPSEASIYASDKLGDEMRDGGNVMSVYVRVVNPLVIETKYPSASMEADLKRGQILDRMIEARKRGEPYDGVIIKRERGDEWDGWNVIAFKPEQIKSAIGNNGNFDPANPDTRLSQDGKAGGMPLRELQSVVDRVAAANPRMPDAVVLASPSDPAVPPALRRFIESQGAMDDVEGALHEGVIYLFASGLADAARAEHVLAEHELAHFGLQAILGGSRAAVMELIYEQNPSIRQAAEAMRQRGKLTVAEAVEEVLVDKPTGELARLKGWRQFTARVRDWLAGHGFTAMAKRLDDLLRGSLSDQQRADLMAADLVRAARDYVAGRESQASLGVQTRLTASTAGREQRQDAWMQREARERGFKGVEDLMARNYALFERLAALFARKYPDADALSRNPKTKDAYEARIDALFAGAKANLNGARVLDTSDVLGLLGYADRPVVLAEGKVLQGKTKHPNMTAEVWKKVPGWIDSPAAVFDSDTEPGRLVLVAPELVDGSVALIILQPDAKGMAAHLLVNAYDKDGGVPPFARWTRQGMTRYVDQKKFPTVLAASGLRLPSTAFQNQPGTRNILTEKNLAGYVRARGQSALSRAPQQKTAAQRADDILADTTVGARPLDAVARAAAKFTGLERLTGAIYDRAAGLLARLTPETVKAGVVSDYGVPEAVIDRRTMLQGAQRVQLRKAGELIDKLSTLTREESRIAYEWMNMDGADPAAYVSMMQGLPEESVKVLQEVQKMIDVLSQDAVDLGQLDKEAFKRNRYAYLRRSYAKHVLEQDEGEKSRRTRIISILGEQYKGRGMTEAVPMAKIKAADWWGRKEQEGKADTALKGEKLIRLERRTLKENDVTVRRFKNGKMRVLTKTREAMDGGAPDLPGIEVAERDTRVREVVYWPASQPIPQQYAEWDQEGTWEVRDVKGGSAVLWRDFTKDERETMGEVDEARFAIAKTLQAMIHDVEVGRYLEWVARNYSRPSGDSVPGTVVEASENRARAMKPGEWVKVPSTEIPGTSVLKYGKLAGRYVEGPVWNDIRQTVNGQFKVGKVYDAVLRAWKTSKTALSPGVHMNNIMSNLVMADWHDVSAAHVAKALRIILGASEREGKGALGNAANVLARAGIADAEAAREILIRYRDSGGDIGSWATAEIARDQMEPLLDAVRAELGKGEGADAMAAQIGVMAALQQLMQMQFRGAWSALKGARPDKAAVNFVITDAKNLIDLYQAEDDVFRLAAWLAAKERGADDLTAGRSARKSFLDYNINAPWIQAMRGTLFPFIGFTYRAIPMLAEIAGKKPHKLLKLMALAGGLNALGVMLAGGGDDEERTRKLLPEEKAGGIWGMVPKLIRMPWNDANGSPVYLDIRRFIPVGDVFDIGATHAAFPIPPWLQVGGPLALMGELMFNSSLFTGKEITKDTDTPAEKASKVFDHLYKSFAPNILGLPGTYATTGAWEAYKGKTDVFNREQSVAQAVASSFGVKLGSYPEDVLRRSATAKVRAEEMEIDKNIAQLKRQRQTKRIDDEEFREQVQRQQEKKRKINQDLVEKLR